MITLPLLLPGGSSQVGGRPSDLTQGGLSGAESRADLGKGGIMSKDSSGQAVATQMTQDAQDTEGSQPGPQEVVGEGTVRPTHTLRSHLNPHQLQKLVWSLYCSRGLEML